MGEYRHVVSFKISDESSKMGEYRQLLVITHYVRALKIRPVHPVT
jgi:hypothetical protein